MDGLEESARFCVLTLELEYGGKDDDVTGAAAFFGV